MRPPEAIRLFLFVFFTATFAVAQSTNATVSGIVLDPSGRVIRGADIEIVNDATGIQYPGTTNGEGIYQVPNLPPGPYRIQVSKVGFKTLIKPDIVLNTQDALAINFTLPLGALSETITVQGGTALVNTESATVSTVVDRKFVANLPLNGRSFQDLILLTPGVVTQSPQAGSAPGYNGDFSVNGQRGESNYYTVDGVSANTGAGDGTGLPGAGSSGSLPAATSLGTTQSLVSVDALQEFRVQSSTYSAQFGHNPGGQFSFVTRSGTNEFHGSAFDYLRNNYFDANNWFNDYYRVAEPALRQNDFGGTFGGPASLPHLYSGKNRTFFFLSYEALRLTSPQAASLEFVPSLSLRQNASPSIQPVLNAFPKPTPGGTDSGNGLASFSQAFSVPGHINSTSIRIDHNIAPSLRLFFRFSDTPTYTGRQSLSSHGQSKANNQSYTFGANSQLGSNSDNEFRIGYDRSTSTINFGLDNFGGAAPIDLATTLGVGGQPNAFSFFELFFPGVGSTFLLTENASNLSRQWNTSDTLGISRGNHHVSLGMDYRQIKSPLNPVDPQIEYVFTSAQSVNVNSADVALIARNLSAQPIFHETALFVQDDWRALRRLALSFGLRWEVNPPPSSASGGDAYTLIGNINEPDTLQLAPRGTHLWKTAWYNFAPRIGAAWVIRTRQGSETVLRGGGGVYFDTGNQESASAFSELGFRASSILFGVPVPAAAGELNISPSVAPPYATIYASAPHLQLPYTIQWNISLEQSLSKDQALTASYVGASGRRLLEQQQLNLASVNPNFTTVVFNRNGHGSNYQALQIQYQRRISRGLQALGSYTWSHALDYGSTDVALPYLRGNSDFDVRNNLAGALSLDLPMSARNPATKALFNGWGLDGRVMARSGFPVTLNGNLLTDSATGSQYYSGLDLVAGPSLYVHGSQYPGGWAINPAAFSLPTGTEAGNAPRNLVRGFGAVQVNTAVRRDFALPDRFTLQFRAEAFNILNHPIFGQIDSHFTDQQFGQATQTLNQSLATVSSQYQQGGSRSLQFALKLLF